jgi:hypothetical protein
LVAFLVAVVDHGEGVENGLFGLHGVGGDPLDHGLAVLHDADLFFSGYGHFHFRLGPGIHGQQHQDNGGQF